MTVDRKPWADRGSRHARGYGAAWTRLRERILRRDTYLCQICEREGRVTAATEVDHITPKAKGGTDDEGNLQAVCSPCHIAKSAAERGVKPKTRIGADGWPAA